MNGAEEFSVYEFYPDGSCTRVAGSITDLEQAVRTAKACTLKPGARLGVIVKVMITDGNDFCIFLWDKDAGVVFPENVEGRAN